MSSGVDTCECQYIILDQVNEQPVWLDVAFTEAGIYAQQLMIMIFTIETFPLTQCLDNIIK